MRGAIRDALSLIKLRVTALVVVTAAAGMALAPADTPWRWTTLLGVALMVGAANTMNCWIERDSDRFMLRTRTRPLPAGRLTPGFALALGLGQCALSLVILALVSNAVTLALTFVALIVYVAIYTPLKRRSASALLVGAVPGALPPLIGWSAATGELGGGGLALFILLFVWQLPHFIAIAIRRQAEYREAGLRVLPVVHGERLARQLAVVSALALLPASLLPALVVPLGAGYLVVAALLGAGFVVLAARGRGDRRWSTRLFAASLVHLAALALTMFLGAP